MILLSRMPLQRHLDFPVPIKKALSFQTALFLTGVGLGTFQAHLIFLIFT
jgi:hypothetical protein